MWPAQTRSMRVQATALSVTIQGPDLQNILRQSYDNHMRKLRSTRDGRLVYKTSY